MARQPAWGRRQRERAAMIGAKSQADQPSRPAAISPAQTGRRHDRARDVCRAKKEALDRRGPSRHEPLWINRPHRKCRPKFGKCRPKFGKCRPKFGKCRPKFGKCRPKFGKCRPKFGKCRPKFGKCRPNLSEVTPQIWEVPPQIWEVPPQFIGSDAPNFGHISLSSKGVRTL